MAERFTFTVTGTPRPLPRGRHVRGHIVSVADPKAKLWRLAVGRAVDLAVEQSGRALPVFSGAVKLTCIFTFVPPASKIGRLGTMHTHKPDASNLLKLVEDVMEAGGVFKNDSQVSRPHTEKWWGAKPGVVVLVESLDGEARAEPMAASGGAVPDWLLE